MPSSALEGIRCSTPPAHRRSLVGIARARFENRRLATPTAVSTRAPSLAYSRSFSIDLELRLESARQRTLLPIKAKRCGTPPCSDPVFNRRPRPCDWPRSPGRPHCRRSSVDLLLQSGLPAHLPPDSPSSNDHARHQTLTRTRIAESCYYSWRTI